MGKSPVGAMCFVILWSVMIAEPAWSQDSRCPAGTPALSVCESMRQSNSVDLCYLQYARQDQNRELCACILQDDLRQQCLETVFARIEEALQFEVRVKPDGINRNQRQEVLFYWPFFEPKEDIRVGLYQVDDNGQRLNFLGDLYDDGLNGDAFASDSVYSGTFSLGPYDQEQMLWFSAVANSVGGKFADVESKLGFLMVTDLPVHRVPADLSKKVFDAQTGRDILASEIWCGFQPGTPSSRIFEIVSMSGFEVMGRVDEDTYQIRIPEAQNAEEVYRVIERFSGLPEVDFASIVFVSEVQDVIHEENHF